MATLRNIIRDAYRESGIIQKGSVPDADQLQEGLEKLILIFQNVYGEEVGGPFVDINFGREGITNVFGLDLDRETYVQNSFARPSYRLILNIDSPKTIYLDPNPYDGARFALVDVAGNLSTNNVTLDGNGRKIEGEATVVVDLDDANIEWLYRGDLATWVRVNTLTADSESPFPSQFDDLFVIKLAMRLHPRYLVQTANETAMHYRDLKKKFRSRYTTRQEVNSELGLYRTTTYRYLDYFVENDSIRFNKGIIY